MARETCQKIVPAGQNAAAILRALSANGQPMTATAIARATDLNGSSAFNILRTLTQEGFVVFDGDAKTYTPGLGLLEFVTPLLGVSPVGLIRPALTRIAHDYRTMIALWQITDTERVVLIDNIASDRIVQARIAPGSRLPAHAGAIGRCYCAATGIGEAQARTAFDRVRWQAAPSFAEYWRDVGAAREDGHAFDRGALFRGLEIGAVLVRDAAGAPRFGLSNITISGQQSAPEQLEIVHALAETAARIGSALYGRTAPPDPSSQP